MKKRILFAGLVPILFAGLILLLGGCSNEPSFEGRPIHYWKQQLKSKDYMTRYRACTAMFFVGSPWADDTVPDLIGLLRDGEFIVRHEAVIALGKLTPEVAKPAVPELVKLLKDTNHGVREDAARVLKHIDPDEAAKAGIY
jgi:HEAT repeat protein